MFFVIKTVFFGKISQNNSALKIDSIPQTTIFLNGQQIGKTPFIQENMLPGEYSIKLVAPNMLAWETRVTLINSALTYVNREIGDTSDDSAGQVLTLEPLASSIYTEIAVVSDPDGAKISLDGVDTGNQTSIILKNIQPGDHTLVVAYPNYADQIVHLRAAAGFRVNVVLKLRRLPFANPATVVRPTSELIATPSSEMAKPYVIIQTTPTGFLHVRANPDPISPIITDVYPGDKYALEEELNSWTKVKLATISGWVSDQYIQKVK